MTRKYRFASDAVIEATAAREFLLAAVAFCGRGRRPRKTAQDALSLFLGPDPKMFVPWSSIEAALGWAGQLGVATRRTTLADELREIAFEMACTWDPEQGRPLNPFFLSVITIRGRGLALRRLSHYRKEPITVAIRRRSRGRLALLSAREMGHQLEAGEKTELRSLRQVLEDERDPEGINVGDYQLVEEVARGTTGIVYKALHQYTSEVLALKLLNETAAADPVFCQRFFRGAKTMMNLSHPNVVRVADAGGLHEGRPYYVAEFVTGGTLREVIRGQLRLSDGEKLTVLSGALGGLAYAHSLGILHRDFSPDNVLLDGAGRPRITDFDCAYLPSAMTLTATSVPGTLRYMSPERMTDPNSRAADDDVYAFGVLALEVLTQNGELPADELLHTLSERTLFRPLHRTLLRCIAPRERGRYHNAVLLWDDWHKALTRPADRVWWAPVWSPRIAPAQHGGQVLHHARFDRSLLSKANFAHATLVECSFEDSALGNSTFIDATLVRCSFEGAFMLGARMQDAKMDNCSFKMANLERTVWDDVDLASVDLSGANLWGAFLERARNLEEATLEGANFARNALSAAQEKALAKRTDIGRSEHYQAMLREVLERYRGRTPPRYWWLTLYMEDPELILLYY